MHKPREELVPFEMQKRRCVTLRVTATAPLIRGLMFFLSARDYEFTVLQQEEKKQNV